MYKVIAIFTILFSSLLTSAQTTWTVTVGGNMNTTPYFSPQNLVIDEGDIVEWDCIQGTHNINGEQDSFPANPEFFSYKLSSGQASPWVFTFTFNTPGFYNYNCSMWQHYKTQFGTITVNSSAPASPVADFVASATTLTAGGSIDFTDLSANNPTSWSWIFSDGTPGTSTDQNPTGIVYNTAGSFDVTLIATNSTGADTLVKTDYIVAATAPSIAEETLAENILIYPNPFNQSAKLVFSNNEHALYELTVYNLLGKKVQIMNNITGSELILDKGKLLPGVYLIEMRSPIKIFRGRIMVE